MTLADLRMLVDLIVIACLVRARDPVRLHSHQGAPA